MGRLAEVDQACLAIYCRWYAHLLEIDRQLSDSTYLVAGQKSDAKTNPLWQAWRDATKEVVALQRQLGPHSRQSAPVFQHPHRGRRDGRARGTPDPTDRGGPMTDSDPADQLAQTPHDQFQAIKRDMGSQWPEGHFEVDISITTTGRMPHGSVMVASLQSAAKLFVRQGPTIQTSMGGREEFYTNVSLLRAEERLALAVIPPSAICVITESTGGS